MIPKSFESPTYETRTTRDIEDMIAAALARHYDLTWERNKVEHGKPDHIFSGKFDFTTETRRRYIYFGRDPRWPDYWIDKQKIDAMLKLRIPFLLVGFNDVFTYIPVFHVKPYDYQTRGRSDRNDRFDRDLCACFHWKDVVIIGERGDQYPLEKPETK